MTIVVDALIALRWVLEEPGSDAAEHYVHAAQKGSGKQEWRYSSGKWCPPMPSMVVSPAGSQLDLVGYVLIEPAFVTRRHAH